MDNFSPAIAAQIKEAIENSDSILLHCHPNPDSDSVGGVLAMSHILKAWGKHVVIIGGDSELKPSFQVLPGASEILPQNFGSTDLPRFDLFLALDSGGLSQISSLAPVVFPETLNVVVIDHHMSNPGYGHLNLVDVGYPATCALLADLFKAWGVKLNRDVALCLLAGIYSDTGGFRHPPTNQHTFETAGELVTLAPDFSDILFELENQNDPETLRFDGLMLSSIETYFSDTVAIAAVSHDSIVHNGILPRQIQSGFAIHRLISVKNWHIGITLIEQEAGVVKVSFRTRGGVYDLSRLAAEVGGGGHRRAAGARIPGTVEEARTKILEAVARLHPELGLA